MTNDDDDSEAVPGYGVVGATAAAASSSFSEAPFLPFLLSFFVVRIYFAPHRLMMSVVVGDD
jgi:hypothetical protein